MDLSVSFQSRDMSPMSTGVPFAEFAQTLPAPEEDPPDSTVTVTPSQASV